MSLDELSLLQARALACAGGQAGAIQLVQERFQEIIALARRAIRRQELQAQSIDYKRQQVVAQKELADLSTYQHRSDPQTGHHFILSEQDKKRTLAIGQEYPELRQLYT